MEIGISEPHSEGLFIFSLTYFKNSDEYDTVLNRDDYLNTPQDYEKAVMYLFLQVLLYDLWLFNFEF